MAFRDDIHHVRCSDISTDKCHVYDNTIYESIIVARISVDMGVADMHNDVKEHIETWKSTEKGQWCIDNCYKLDVMRTPDHGRYMYCVAIKGLMTSKQATYYRLKWS
jgi:hypothetical protein